MSDRARANFQAQQKALTGSSSGNRLLRHTFASGWSPGIEGLDAESREKRLTWQGSRGGFETPSVPAAAHSNAPAQKNVTSSSAVVERAPHLGHDFRQIPVYYSPRQPVIQTKLQVNQPGDVYEQEADQVAKEVMRKTDPAPGVPDDEDETKSSLMRKERAEPGANAATGPSDVPPTVQAVLNSGGGQPLDTTTQAFMGRRFGHDFSRVRVHTDELAAKSARSVHALAYTVGRDVVFEQGQYAPETSDGKWLLAHELTHVVQQAGTSSTGQQHASHIHIQRFQAGDYGHGGIEKEALTGQFSPDEVSKIYFGNWLRDLSQVMAVSPNLFKLVDILALGEFGREITREDLGTYVASEHLDQPMGGKSIEDPLSSQDRQAAYDKLSPAQKAAYNEEQAHTADIQAAAKASKLPEYIERGKFHAKQQLTEAIGKGRTPEGMEAMGNGLHAIEDYYSHSNFLEVCIWCLHNQGQLTDELVYNYLVGTEIGNNAALLGTWSVLPGEPEIITGSYGTDADSAVSKAELIVTEIQHGQFTKAFIKGAFKNLHITEEKIIERVSEGGKLIGSSAGGWMGKYIGGTLGAVGGAAKGLGHDITATMSSKVEELRARIDAAKGLGANINATVTSPPQIGIVSESRQGWEYGKSAGESKGAWAGGKVGEALGGLGAFSLEVLIDVLIERIGVAAILALFPEIASLMAVLVAAAFIEIKRVKKEKEKEAEEKTREAAQQAESQGLGPSHSELAKDNPQHHLFELARALAVVADRDIGNAMAAAWEQTSSPPSATVVANVTGLVDKYVSYPATDLWWMDTVLPAVQTLAKIARIAGH